MIRYRVPNLQFCVIGVQPKQSVCSDSHSGCRLAVRPAGLLNWRILKYRPGIAVWLPRNLILASALWLSLEADEVLVTAVEPVSWAHVMALILAKRGPRRRQQTSRGVTAIWGTGISGQNVKLVQAGAEVQASWVPASDVHVSAIDHKHVKTDVMRSCGVMPLETLDFASLEGGMATPVRCAQIMRIAGITGEVYREDDRHGRAIQSQAALKSS